MIERFTKEQFEAALPKSGRFPIIPLEIVNGEYCWKMIVGEVGIIIRSSIDSSRISARTGEDSIRVYLVDKQGRPLGSKITKWTTRKPGWQERLADLLRQFVKMILASGADKGGVTIFKCKKEGANKGRFFYKVGESFGGWITNSKGEIE